MDEPTSAIDVHTEDEIMNAMRALARGRTTLVIAHRLSTIQECDLLLVLHQGALVMATPDFQEAVRMLAKIDLSDCPSEQADASHILTQG